MPDQLSIVETFSPSDYFSILPGLNCDVIACNACDWSTTIPRGDDDAIDCDQLSRHLVDHDIVVVLSPWPTPFRRLVSIVDRFFEVSVVLDCYVIACKLCGWRESIPVADAVCLDPGLLQSHLARHGVDTDLAPRSEPSSRQLLATLGVPTDA